MQVSISGSSGFTGKEMINILDNQGIVFTVINRDSFGMSDAAFLEQKIEGKDAVINLAGAPILQKWTTRKKEEIYNSRIDTTNKIARAIREAKVKPKVFVSASAIGIYSSVGTHTETSNGFADDFLSKVCHDWEAAAMSVSDITRVVILRTGIVFGNTGGALPVMHKPFSMALGGTIGKGTQPLSWIHIRDLVNIYKFVIENDAFSGIVNAVAPNPTTNFHFTKTFAKIINQPAVFRIPLFALKARYGEAAATLIEGQTVIPEKLNQSGFRFEFPTIEKALLNLYRKIV
ncbi:MAG TPA: TIGR01777 family oxidoreductase [Bacteroidales bacterium]|nr:TIGR01777 family oxidoreductase [Bacteroidales bacterium]